MKSKHREEAVYGAVRAGWFEIRADGAVWRVAQRRVNKWNKKEAVKKLSNPHRVDPSVGVGYRIVHVMVNRVQFTCLAHRLVWLHLHGPIPSNMTINHKNGVKHDNRPENLELATMSENTRHAVRVLKVGRTAHQDGEANHAAKLSNLQVEGIRFAYQSGRMTQKELAEEYGVRHQAISKIVRGERRCRQSGPTADYTANRFRGIRTRNSKGQFHG